MGHFYVVPVCGFHHAHIHHFPKLMRSLWQQTMDTLGVVMSWPASKIVRNAHEHELDEFLFALFSEGIMRLRVDKTGRRYGRLVVLSPAPRMGKSNAWLCQCDCGNQIAVRTGGLRPGNPPGSTFGCGCAKREGGKHLRTHGARYTTEYNSWKGIHDRCETPANKMYYLYGARGIRMCERWKDFSNFLADMGHKPSPKHSIDRIDVNGNYEPGNCRWATPVEQQNNKRNTVYATIGTERLPLKEIAKRYAVSYGNLYQRFRTRGQPIEVALSALTNENPFTQVKQ